MGQTRMQVVLKCLGFAAICSLVVTTGYMCHIRILNTNPPPSIQQVTPSDVEICSQSYRLDTLERTCLDHPGYKNVTEDSFWRFIVDEPNKVVFCSIPKSGSTSVHHMMSRRMSKLRYLNSYSMSDIKKILKSFIKVIVVRHPLLRLYSAYNDRIHLKHLRVPEPYYDVVKHYYPDRIHNSSLDLSFDEFLRMVALEYESGKFVNRHWMTFDELCLPCLAKFDFIGKLETFDSDSSGILYAFNSTKYTRMDNVHTNHSNVQIIIDHFKKVPEFIMKRVNRVYSKDFNQFGYHKLSLSMPECLS